MTMYANDWAPRAIILAGASASLFLVAVWAGRSRRHWFLGVSAVCLTLLLLYPIRAHEPLVMFMFALPAVSVASRLLGRQRDADRCARRSAAPNGPPRFRIRMLDWLLLALLAGVVSVLLAGLWCHGTALDWPRMCGAAFCLTVVAQLSVAVVLTRGWCRALVGMALPGSACGSAATHAWLLDDWMVLLCPVMSISATLRFAAALLFYATLAALIVSAFALARYAARVLTSWTIRLRWAALTGLTEATLVVSMPLAFVYVHMLDGPPAQAGPHTASDSFARVLSLTRQVRALNPGEATREDLRTAGDSVTAAGLDQICAQLVSAVDQPGHGSPDLDPFTEDLHVFRGLSRTWSAEVHAAARAGEFPTVSRLGGALVQLGNMLSRGGLVVHALSGISIEVAGVCDLGQHRDAIPLSEIPSLLAKLEVVHRTCEHPDVTTAREEAWLDDRYGWVPRFDSAMAFLSDQGTARLRRIWSPAIQRRDAYLRLLMTHLAIRLFQSERGRLPETLG